MLGGFVIAMSLDHHEFIRAYIRQMIDRVIELAPRLAARIDELIRASDSAARR